MKRNKRQMKEKLTEVVKMRERKTESVPKDINSVNLATGDP